MTEPAAWFLPLTAAEPTAPLDPAPHCPIPMLPAPTPKRQVRLTINGREVLVPEGSTLLQAAVEAGLEVPTLCYLETLTPVNVCRLCVVELEGSRTLVPACSRKAEEGMVVKTDSERVRLSRRLVLEFLASSVDVSTSRPRTDQLRPFAHCGGRFCIQSRYRGCLPKSNSRPVVRLG